MDRSIILATDIEADRARVFEILSTTQGQRGFWTADCEVLFRHYGFGEGYAEIDFAHTAQTWALILARLSGYAASGQPQPFFPAPT